MPMFFTTLAVCAVLVTVRLLAVHRGWVVGRLISVWLLFFYALLVTFGTVTLPRLAVIDAHENGLTGDFVDGVRVGSMALAPVSASIGVCFLAFFLIALFPGRRR